MKTIKIIFYVRVGKDKENAEAGTLTTVGDDGNVPGGHSTSCSAWHRLDTEVTSPTTEKVVTPDPGASASWSGASTVLNLMTFITRGSLYCLLT